MAVADRCVPTASPRSDDEAIASSRGEVRAGAGRTRRAQIAAEAGMSARRGAAARSDRDGDRLSSRELPEARPSRAVRDASRARRAGAPDIIVSSPLSGSVTTRLRPAARRPPGVIDLCPRRDIGGWAYMPGLASGRSASRMPPWIPSCSIDERARERWRRDTGLSLHDLVCYVSIRPVAHSRNGPVRPEQASSSRLATRRPCGSRASGSRPDRHARCRRRRHRDRPAFVLQIGEVRSRTFAS